MRCFSILQKYTYKLFLPFLHIYQKITLPLLYTTNLERAQLEAMLKAMIEGIVSVDSRGRVFFSNKAAYELLGGDLSASSQQEITTAPGYKHLVTIITQAKHKRTPVIAEINIPTDTKTNILNIHACSFHVGKSQDDISQGVILVIHDMTRMRHLEKVRKDFVANVSHEIKTPLTSIHGYVETLLSGAVYDNKINVRFLHKIQSNTERLILLVQDILNLAKIEDDTPSLYKDVLTWDYAIDQIKHQYEESIASKKLRLKINVPDLVYVQSSQEGMLQILDNLVSNAIRYSHSHGKIIISVSANKHFGILSISDTGIGIPSQDIDRIFERFYRVDKDRSRPLGGTGLGLAIVKHLVCQMQGKIEVSSSVGKGSTFSVFLPLRTAPPTPIIATP